MDWREKNCIVYVAARIFALFPLQGGLGAEQKLFLGGLTYGTTNEMLHEFYSQWGELVDVIVMRDATTNRSRGFGFVTYAQQTQLEAAMTARPHIIDGKTVDTKIAIPKDVRQTTLSLRVCDITVCWCTVAFSC